MTDLHERVNVGCRQQWMNQTIEMCPGVKAVEMFLADDSSLDPSMEARLVSRLGSQTVTTAADAAPLDAMSPSGSSISSGPVAGSLTGSGVLPAELTLEGRAQARAAEEAAALKEKEQAETMDPLPKTLVITSAAEEIGGKHQPSARHSVWLIIVGRFTFFCVRTQNDICSAHWVGEHTFCRRRDLMGPDCGTRRQGNGIANKTEA